ncbi:MAG: MFS transporter [Alphaproteobacteria bacterium]|nr:MFS transporter [Alphaproteobacteria bacterium]
MLHGRAKRSKEALSDPLNARGRVPVSPRQRPSERSSMSALATADRPREGLKVVAIVSSAHFFSHFYQFALAPLFPILKGVYGVSYAELAVLISVLFVASSSAQVVIGFFVDRFGARNILITGATLMSGAFFLIAFFPTYEAALVLMVFVGLGNAVFHPADFAIFQGSVPKSFVGRAFSLHSLSGNMGWASAPPVVGGLAALWGWQAAVIATGLAGLATAGLVIVYRQMLLDDSGAKATAASDNGFSWADTRHLFTAPILSCFFFFLMISITLIAFNTFAVPAFTTGYGYSPILASALLTAFLVAFTAAIFPGGVLADRIENHDRWTAFSFTLGGALILLVGIVAMPLSAIFALLIVAGLFFGSAMPSRDMIVRKAAPEGFTGRVFGFVYSALDVGGALAPLAFGWLLAVDRPKEMFIAVGLALVLAGFSAILATRWGPPRGRPVKV